MGPEDEPDEHRRHRFRRPFHEAQAGHHNTRGRGCEPATASLCAVAVRSGVAPAHGRSGQVTKSTQYTGMPGGQTQRTRVIGEYGLSSRVET